MNAKRGIKHGIEPNPLPKVPIECAQKRKIIFPFEDDLLYCKGRRPIGFTPESRKNAETKLREQRAAAEQAAAEQAAAKKEAAEQAAAEQSAAERAAAEQAAAKKKQAAAEQAAAAQRAEQAAVEQAAAAERAAAAEQAAAVQRAQSTAFKRQNQERFNKPRERFNKRETVEEAAAAKEAAKKDAEDKCIEELCKRKKGGTINVRDWAKQRHKGSCGDIFLDTVGKKCAELLSGKRRGDHVKVGADDSNMPSPPPPQHSIQQEDVNDFFNLLLLDVKQ